VEPKVFAGAALEAVSAVLPVLLRDDGGLDGSQRVAPATSKADGSPVTTCDVAVQAVLAHLLRARLGNIPIIGEENAWPGGGAQARGVLEKVAAALGAGAGPIDEGALAKALARAEVPPGAPYAAVDPIDGTKGFLAGGQYAVCVAWVEGGVSRVGIVACPRLDPSAPIASIAARRPTGTVFVAVDGDLRVAAVSPEGRVGPARPVAPSHGTGEGRTLVTSRALGHTDPAAVRELAAALGGARVVRMDGQGKVGLVACGRADVYVRVPRAPGRAEPVWDHAAGIALARAAGLRVCDARGGPIDLSRPPVARGAAGAVVAPEALADCVLAVVRRRLGEGGPIPPRDGP